MLSLTDPTPDQYGQTKRTAPIFRFPTDVGVRFRSYFTIVLSLKQYRKKA